MYWRKRVVHRRSVRLLLLHRVRERELGDVESESLLLDAFARLSIEDRSLRSVPRRGRLVQRALRRVQGALKVHRVERRRRGRGLDLCEFGRNVSADGSACRGNGRRRVHKHVERKGNRSRRADAELGSDLHLAAHAPHDRVDDCRRESSQLGTPATSPLSIQDLLDKPRPAPELQRDDHQYRSSEASAGVRKLTRKDRPEQKASSTSGRARTLPTCRCRYR